eukprot:3799245-Prymnesium_polylepis.1
MHRRKSACFAFATRYVCVPGCGCCEGGADRVAQPSPRRRTKAGTGSCPRDNRSCPNRRCSCPNRSWAGGRSCGPAPPLSTRTTTCRPHSRSPSCEAGRERACDHTGCPAAGLPDFHVVVRRVRCTGPAAVGCAAQCIASCRPGSRCPHAG